METALIFLKLFGLIFLIMVPIISVVNKYVTPAHLFWFVAFTFGFVFFGSLTMALIGDFLI